MHVKIAKCLPGGMGNFPLSPKFAAYLAFAVITSFTISLMSVLLGFRWLAKARQVSQRHLPKPNGSQISEPRGIIAERKV
jgi:hypothetical protein